MILGLSVTLELPVVMSPSLGSSKFRGRIQGGECWIRGYSINFPKLLPKEVLSPKGLKPYGLGGRARKGCVCFPVWFKRCSLS